MHDTLLTKHHFGRCSEYTDVVAYPVLLVLCYALGNPGDVADFLLLVSAKPVVEVEEGYGPAP